MSVLRQIGSYQSIQRKPRWFRTGFRGSRLGRVSSAQCAVSPDSHCWIVFQTVGHLWCRAEHWQFVTDTLLQPW